SLQPAAQEGVPAELSSGGRCLPGCRFVWCLCPLDQPAVQAGRSSVHDRRSWRLGYGRRRIVTAVGVTECEALHHSWRYGSAELDSGATAIQPHDLTVDRRPSTYAHAHERTPDQIELRPGDHAAGRGDITDLRRPTSVIRLAIRLDVGRKPECRTLVHLPLRVSCPGWANMKILR